MREIAATAKAIVVPELNMGQMSLEVERAVAGAARVIGLPHAGGTVPYLASRFSLLWLREPDLAERAPAGALEYLSRMYYDTALSANPLALASLSALVGWDHVLFGSDFPFAPELATTLSVMALDEDPRFDAASREQVRRTNALDLFPRIAERLDLSESVPSA